MRATDFERETARLRHEAADICRQAGLPEPETQFGLVPFETPAVGSRPTTREWGALVRLSGHAEITAPTVNAALEQLRILAKTVAE